MGYLMVTSSNVDEKGEFQYDFNFITLQDFKSHSV